MYFQKGGLDGQQGLLPLKVFGHLAAGDLGRNAFALQDKDLQNFIVSRYYERIQLCQSVCKHIVLVLKMAGS